HEGGQGLAGAGGGGDQHMLAPLQARPGIPLGRGGPGEGGIEPGGNGGMELMNDVFGHHRYMRPAAIDCKLCSAGPPADAQCRTSSTILASLWAARRTRPKPASLSTAVSRFSP